MRALTERCCRGRLSGHPPIEDCSLIRVDVAFVRAGTDRGRCSPLSCGAAPADEDKLLRVVDARQVDPAEDDGFPQYDPRTMRAEQPVTVGIDRCAVHDQLNFGALPGVLDDVAELHELAGGVSVGPHDENCAVRAHLCCLRRSVIQHEQLIGRQRGLGVAAALVV